MAWNEIDGFALAALLRSERERPYAVVILPADVSQWRVAGPVLDALGDSGSSAGVSSTCGAEHISGANADVFVYRLPGGE